MAFQPFGYRFEVSSPSQPRDVKAAIRSRKKGWFDAQNGARGWIMGPFICLWFSALDRNGPMLFGKISRGNLGTRITGRAGSDLNGVAVFTLWLPVMALLLYLTVSAGDYTWNYLAFVCGVILFSPLVLWWSHQDRRDAEPLVRFFRDAVTASGRTLRAKAATVTVSEAFTLNVNEESRAGPVTPDAIHDALLALGRDDFVILESGPENYIQTKFHDGGYVLEMRNGDKERHFRAIRRHVAPKSPSDSPSIFTFEEVREAFIAYASEAPMPPFLTWERMHFPA